LLGRELESEPFEGERSERIRPREFLADPMREGKRGVIDKSTGLGEEAFRLDNDERRSVKSEDVRVWLFVRQGYDVAADGFVRDPAVGLTDAPVDDDRQTPAWMAMSADHRPSGKHDLADGEPTCGRTTNANRAALDPYLCHTCFDAAGALELLTAE
jgi:hypothetical protein